MAFNLKNRSFLKEIDFEPQELRFLLRLSEALKLAKYAGTETRHLAGQEIALIFEKTSTRTRSAFEVGAYDQGAHVTYLDPSGSQLGHKESIADTAAVLGRMYDAIEFRGTRQSDVEELAAHAGVPVYNGLTDEWHPTQMLADFLTMHESSGKPYDRIAYAFVGDCRFNMGRSLLVMGALMGSDVRLSGPEELHRRADHHHRRPRPRRARRRLHPHRRVGVDGRSQRRLDRPGPSAHPLPGQHRPDGSQRQPGGQIHALPARLPRPQHHRRPRNHGTHRHDRWPRSHRRRLQLRRQHRLRPSRKPPPHHQSHPRRHPRITSGYPQAAGGTMSTPTVKQPTAISDDSKRQLGRLVWASSLIISNLVTLVVGIVIGNIATKRIAKGTRGLT